MAEETFDINTLADEGWDVRYRNPVKTFETGKEFLERHAQSKSPVDLAYGKLLVGVSNFLRSVEDNTLSNLMEALKIFESAGNEKGQVRSLIFLSNLSDNHGNLGKGIEYGKKGLKLAEKIGDREAESDLLGTLGQIYSRMADYQQAIESFNKSLMIRESLGNIQAMASSLNLIARTYSLKGDFELSLEFYKKSLKIREDTLDLGALPWTYLGMASLFEKMKDDESAAAHYQKGMDLNTDSRDLRCKLYCCWGMGKIQTRKKQLPQALENLQSALEICETLQFKPIAFEIHFSLAEAYETEGNLAESLKHFKLFQAIKEEVLNAESANKLKRQEINFAIEKSAQEAEIHRLKNVELKAAFEVIEEKNQHITKTIQYARRIQHAMLPVIEEIGTYLNDYFIMFLPKDIVSGDFYWFQHQDNTHFMAAVDCTGHGVPGALMSMIGNSFLNQLVVEKGLRKPSQVLNELHDSIKTALKQKGQSVEFGGETRDGMDLALCSLRQNESGEMLLEYAGANRPFLLIRAGELTEIKADKFPIGGADPESQRLFTNHAITLQKGDAFYLFTDGIGDQFNELDKKLGKANLRNFLSNIHMLPMKEQEQKARAFFDQWKGSTEQTDDVLLIGVRV